MVQSLEAIEGGGGSIRVGTITQAVPASVASSSSTPKRPRQRKSSDEASSSGSNSFPTPEFSRKTKGYYPKNTHGIPILGSENIALDRTPSREKTEKKTHNIVEVVDIKCGNSDKAWTSPITNRLRKLGFSKLSESII
ncbi:hypothetical protein UlMin_003532 [Ulmus minor]